MIDTTPIVAAMTLRRRAFEAASALPAGREVVSFFRALQLRQIGEPPTHVRFDRLSGGWIHEADGETYVLAEPRGPGIVGIRNFTRRAFLRDYQLSVGDVVIDVGAGVGTETIPFAHAIGATGRAVAIEAHPSTFALLKRAVDLNSLTHVTLHNAAATETVGTVSFTDAGADQNHVNRVGSGSLRVEGIPLAQVLEEINVERVDFLKMNIEGAELSALLGLGPYIRHVRHMAVSCHDFLAEQTGDESYRTKLRVTELLEDEGFSIKTFDDDDHDWARDYVFATHHSCLS